MSFPLRLPDQLKQHLRALRKSRGLTQVQLGALVGVQQARIAEIEAHPGLVSLDQITKVLAALGGTLHLHSADAVAPQGPGVVVPAPVIPVKVSGVQRKAQRAPKPAPRTRVVIRPKKGAW